MSNDIVMNQFELPEFANKENQELYHLIQESTQRLSDLKQENADLQERVKTLADHKVNVENQVKNTQDLLTAKEEQASEEKHLQQICLREKGKIESELTKLDNDTRDIQSKWSVVQSKIATSQRRIDVLKEQSKLNQQELEQWMVLARQKEEDYLVLERYKREDEGRVRSMLLEIEKATGIYESKKEELEKEVTATRALQIQLDMTADQFRKMHEERTTLLNQWSETLEQMNKLNQQIEATSNSFNKRKDDVTKLHNSVLEHKKNLDLAEAENQKLERQLTIGDHDVSQKHKDYEKGAADLQEFSETVETARHQREKLEGDIRAHQEEIKDLQNKTEQENEKKHLYLKRLQETQNALTVQNDQTDDLNKQTDIMKDFLKREEDQLKQIETSIELEKKQIYKLSQDVYDARMTEKNLLADIQGSQTRAKNLQLKISVLDRETQKQMELLYNSNFQIQQMERKIARIEGERTEEEKLELQTQLNYFTKILNAKLEDEKSLNQQLNRLELDLRQTARKKENLEKAHADLGVKLNELNLDQESLDKSVIKTRSEKETVLVQLNMLRLQVEKLSEQVSQKSDELISLENRRQQLQLSMQERILEIDSHIAALSTQLKTEEEARHAAMIEFKEREKRTQTLASKYEVVMGKYKVDGEEVTQSYHIIKFAKEREELNRRGDELDAQVKKALAELKALDKQNQKLEEQNQKFRKGFMTVGKSDNDIERKKVLEENVKVIQQRLNAHKAEARSISEERSTMEKTLQQQRERTISMQAEINKLVIQKEKLEKANVEMSQKIKRATNSLTKAKTEHRIAEKISLNAPYPATLLEMDIELRMIKANVDTAVNDLVSLAERCGEIQSQLKLALAPLNLNLNSMMKSGPSRSPPSLLKPKNPSIITPITSSNNSGRSSSKSSTRSTTSIKSNGSTASRSSANSTASSVSNGSHISVHQIGLI